MDSSFGSAIARSVGTMILVGAAICVGVGVALAYAIPFVWQHVHLSVS